MTVGHFIREPLWRIDGEAIMTRDVPPKPADKSSPKGSQAANKTCVVTVILLQINYVNNSGTIPVKAKLHGNVEGYDMEDWRTLEASGTLDLPLWFREKLPGRCGTDVEISFVMDVSLSPRAETSPLDAHLAAVKQYKCPSHKDHEIFKLTVGDPNDGHIIFDFVFRVKLECRNGGK